MNKIIDVYSNSYENKDKYFLVNLSDLEGYFSPLFFKSKPNYIPHAKRLKDIATVNPVRPRPKFGPDELVPYVGLPQTDEHTHSIKEVILRPFKEVDGRGIIYPKDILFARIEPSVFNKKYIEVDDLHGYPFAFTSTEFYIVESPLIDNQYLFFSFLTDYVYNQVVGKTTGSTGRRRLDPEVFSKLLIPVPDNQTISKVVKIINEARLKKAQKLAESKALLESIDIYLLEELGLNLPHQERTINVRIFTTSLKKITGNNYSPQLYTYYNDEFIKSIKSGIYKTEYVKNISKNVFQGVSQKLTAQNEFTLLKVKNIQKHNRISYDEIEYVGSVPEFKILQAGDIIAPFIGEAIRQNKFSVFYPNVYDGKCTVDNNTGVIRLNSSCNSTYIASLLMSSIGVQQVRNLIGGGVPFIGSSKISKILLPIPPLDTQNSIAKQLDKIYRKSLKLEIEAKDVLESARKLVEQIILKLE